MGYSVESWNFEISKWEHDENFTNQYNAACHCMAAEPSGRYRLWDEDEIVAVWDREHRRWVDPSKADPTYPWNTATA